MYSKKSKEDLFLIFLLGGLFGFLDSRAFHNSAFDIGYLIGSGLGFLIIIVPISLILNALLSYRGKNNPEQEETILDNELAVQEEKTDKREKIKEKRPFKKGIYIAFFFVIIAIIQSF